MYVVFIWWKADILSRLTGFFSLHAFGWLVIIYPVDHRAVRNHSTLVCHCSQTIFFYQICICLECYHFFWRFMDSTFMRVLLIWVCWFLFGFFSSNFVHCLSMSFYLWYRITLPMNYFSFYLFPAEFNALKEECSSLRKRIQAIEAEMKM